MRMLGKHIFLFKLHLINLLSLDTFLPSLRKQTCNTSHLQQASISIAVALIASFIILLNAEFSCLTKKYFPAK